MLNKTMHKTRLNQNTKEKHISNANKKTRRGERERKSDRITWSPFPSTLGRTFPFSEPLIWRWGERVKTIQVRKEHEGFEKISKRSKRG